MKWFFRLAALAAGLLAASAAQAQAYPSKPVRLVVPFAAGGPADVLARSLSAKLTESLEQAVVIDIKPGASGMAGSAQVAQSAPDGYTLVLSSTSSHAVAPALVAKKPYDPVKDFTPVAMVASFPLVLVVHPSVPAKSVSELVALAKAQPGRINYGTSGIGSSLHLATELFKSQAGIDIVHIPYKGSGQAAPELVAGRVSMMIDVILSAMPHIRSGKIRPLAVTSPQRSRLLPDVATLAESGFPGFEAVSWNGILAPAGTPPEIVKKLHTEITRALQSPEVRERLAAQGAEFPERSPAQFGAYLRSEVDKWSKVIRDSGAKPE